MKEIIGLMVNGQALGSEDIDPPSCFLRKAASTLSSIWARSRYSKRGAHSWRGDTSTLPPYCNPTHDETRWVTNRDTATYDT